MLRLAMMRIGFLGIPGRLMAINFAMGFLSISDRAIGRWRSVFFCRHDKYTKRIQGA